MVAKSPSPKTLSLATAIILAGTCSAIAGAASNLSLTASDATIGVGQKLVVTVGLNGDTVGGVGAQFILDYDQAFLSLDSSSGNSYALSSGAALDLELYENDDSSTGIYKLALGLTSGTANVNLAAGGFVVLTFTCTADFCAASNKVAFVSSGGFSSMISTAAGTAVTLGSATNLDAVTRDTVSPSLVSVPANRSFWADANGSNAAAVTIVAPTGSDSCDGSVDITYVRTAGSGLMSFGAGAVTTITWTATDDCGNTATNTTAVDVSASSVMFASLAMGGSFTTSSFTRGVTVATTSGAGFSVSDTISLATAGSGGTSRAQGTADFTVSGAVDWTSACATVRDPLHTLRRALTIGVGPTNGSLDGREFNSSYGVNGSSSSDYLVVGNGNADAVIDIFDFSVFVTQRGATNLGIDTTSSSTGPHTDFNASGVVSNADLSFLSVNFFAVDESCGGYTGGQTPLASISVKQLRRMGLGAQAMADVNNDGWVDTTDMMLVMQGAVPVQQKPISTSSNTAW